MTTILLPLGNRFAVCINFRSSSPNSSATADLAATRAEQHNNTAAGEVRITFLRDNPLFCADAWPMSRVQTKKVHTT
jgi:hypothetical protein